jgi:hypothetical protein
MDHASFSPLSFSKSGMEKLNLKGTAELLKYALPKGFV